jgi:PAS domain S-box-containing protein
MNTGMTNIRIRLFAYLFLLFIVSFVILFATTATLISREYASFEKELIVKNTKQLQKGYRNILDNLESKARDWSIWDDAYNFMQTKDKKFIESNLSVDTVCEMQMNYILFVDEEGQIVAKKGCDFLTKSDIPLPVNFAYHLSKGRLLINHPEMQHVYTGLIDTTQGALILTAQPILKTNTEGPARGTLIFARFLTKDELSTYSNPDSTISINQITVQQYEKIRTEAVNESTIISSFDLFDIYNSPVIRVTSKTSRVIYNKRIVAFQYLFVSLFSGGFLLLLGHYLVVEQLITKKIMALIRAIADISQKKEINTIDIPIISREKDELNTLQSSLNSMLHSLQMLSSGLVNEQQKAQQYLDLMNSVVRVLDQNHKILLINKKGCEVLGYSKEELIGKDYIHMFIPDTQQDQVKNILDSIINNTIGENGVVENQNEIVSKSGKRILIRWHHAPVKDEHGQIIAIVSSGFDMTAEIDAKTQLETRVKEMEQMNKIMVNRELAMIELKKKIKHYES